MNDETLPPHGNREASARTLVKVGAVSAVSGIALALADDEGIARWLTLAGVVLLVMGGSPVAGGCSDQSAAGLSNPMMRNPDAVNFD